MENRESLQLFEDQPIRTAWDNASEEWFFLSLILNPNGII